MSGPLSMITTPPRVLLVEDDAELRAEIAEALKDAGASVESLSDAAAALSVLAEDPDITVLLTDLCIPGGDGMSLGERALSLRGPHTALEVVLLTGYATLDVAVEAVKKKIFEFLRKPIRLTELEDAVTRAHLSAVRRREAARGPAAEIARLQNQASSLLNQLQTMKNNPALVGQTADDGLMILMKDGLINPLVPISGLAQIIEDEGSTLSNETLITYARHIRAAGDRLTLLIEAITALADFNSPGARKEVSKTASRAVSVLTAVERQPWFDSLGEPYGLDIDTKSIAYINSDPRSLVLILGLCLSQLLQTCTDADSAISLRVIEADHEVTFVVASAKQVVSTSTRVADGTVADQDYVDSVKQHATLGLGFRLAMQLSAAISAKFEIKSSQASGTLIILTVPRNTTEGTPSC